MRRVDQEWEKLFRDFNEFFFGGRLPSYQVRIVDHLTPKNPKCPPGGRTHRGERLIEITAISCFGDRRNRFEVAASLLHEMCHAATGYYHGQRFKGEVMRLKQFVGEQAINLDHQYDLSEGTEVFQAILRCSPFYESIDPRD